MMHLRIIKSVVMWLHILVVSLLVCVCRIVRESTDVELPDDGVTATPKHVL